MREARSSGYEAVGRAAARELQSVLGVQVGGAADQLHGYIAQDSRFLYDPKATILEPYARSQVIGVLQAPFQANQNKLLTENFLDTALAEVKQRLEGIPEVARYRAARQRALALATALREALKERVLRPYELR